MHVQTQQLPIWSFTISNDEKHPTYLRNLPRCPHSLTHSLTPSLLLTGPLLFHATYVFSCLLSWHGPRMVNVSMYTYIHSPTQFSNLRKLSNNEQFLDPPTYPWLILCACMTNSTSGGGGGGGVSQQHTLKNTLRKSTRPWFKPTEYHVVLDYGRVDIRTMLFETCVIWTFVFCQCSHT